MVKKVIFVGKFDLYTPICSGVRGYILGLSKAFNNLGIETKLIGYSAEIDSNEEFINIIKEKNVSELKFTISLYIKSILLRFSKKIPEDAIIHVQRADHAFPFLFFNNKLIFTMHGKTEEAKKKHGLTIYFFYSLIERIIVKRCDFTIAVSEDIKNYFVNKYPCLKNKIVVIHNGVDLTSFKKLKKEEVKLEYKLDNEKIILFIGRLHPEKNIEFLIKSFSLLKDRLDKIRVRLLIVGDGISRNDLLKLTEELKISDKVSFLGELDYLEVPKVINCADVFALTSIAEGFPLVVLESLACGVPVVSTNVGDVAKVVVNNKTGFVVKSSLPSDFAKKLEYVTLNSKMFTENCINMARIYSWESVSRKTLELYETFPRPKIEQYLISESQNSKLESDLTQQEQRIRY